MSIFVQFFAFYGYALVALQYLQLVRGDTALLAAVQVLPLAGAMIPTSRLAPRLTARFSNRTVAATGLAAPSRPRRHKTPNSPAPEGGINYEIDESDRGRWRDRWTEHRDRAASRWPRGRDPRASPEA
jgi:hypothetical protein